MPYRTLAPGPSGHRHAVSGSRSRLLVVVVLVLAALGVGLPVNAQTDGIEDDKAQREAVRAEKAQAAAELDPLLAEDADLADAVATLDENVGAQQARLDSIRQSMAAAREEAQQAADRVAMVESELVDLRDLVRLQAIDAYTRPGARDLASFLSTNDITVAAHKQALIDTVTSQEIDFIDLLRSKQDDLEVFKGEVDDALAVVEAEEAAELEQLAVLEDALADQRRLREALRVRIEDVQAEIDALDAEEAGLSELIRQAQLEEEARIAAEKQAAEIAAANKKAAQATANEVVRGDSETDPPVATPPPLPPPDTSTGLIWPAGGVVSSFYGPRWGRMHQGIDIAAGTGSAVVAAKGGTVIAAGVNGGYGNMVVVDHGGGFSTVYAHLTDIYVSSGQSVGQGEGLGTVGCTGNCTGPHLHFETRVNGIAQDPMLYLG